jgi:hypothetical protein
MGQAKIIAEASPYHFYRDRSKTAILLELD